MYYAVRVSLYIVFVFGLCCGVWTDAYANSTCAGTAEPILTFNGLTIDVVGACTITAGDLNSQGVARVFSQNATFGNSLSLGVPSGTAIAQIQADPPSGIDADITVTLPARLQFNGQPYHSTAPLMLTAHVASWPPSSETEYTVSQDITYSGNCGQFTISAGSTVTLTVQ